MYITQEILQESQSKSGVKYDARCQGDDGPNRNSDRPGQKCDRIEEPHKLRREKRAYQEEDEDGVLKVSKLGITSPRFSLEKVTDYIQSCTQGANPPAEISPKGNGESQHQKCPDETSDECPGG